jgi:hypothetical protein
MEFQQQLDAAIETWNSGEADDEWLFQRIRENRIGQMTSAEAWNQIGETVTKLLNQQNEATATEIVETIMALAARSMTTEVPQEITSSQDRLRQQFAGYGNYAREQLENVFRYYRI